MKNAWIIAPVLFLAIFSGSAVAGQVVDSRITDVTVFANRAMVTRNAAADVEAGMNRLVVNTGAFDIVTDSVRVAVFGDGEILGVQIVRTPMREMPQEKIRELTDRIEVLEKEKKGFLDAKQALSRQEAFLDGYVDFTDRSTDTIKITIPSTQEIESYLSFFDEKYNAIYDQRRLIDERIVSTEKEIQRLKRELSMHRGFEERMQTGIEILFNSPAAKSLTIETRYLVNAVRWSPVYRASVEGDIKDVNLSMMAAINQQTGEAWRDVNLTISNAVPVQAGRLPELSPWWMDYRPPVPLRNEVGAKFRSMEMMDTAAAPPVEAIRKETALSFEYTLPVPVTIASREQETQVPILTRTIEGQFYHYTVPAMGTDAYLVCEAKTDRELLPGPVNVFFENSYTGRMMLDEKGPGDSFTLGLGVDRSVRVKREKLEDKVRETAFFGRVERDTVIRELSYRIRLENMKKKPVTLKVTDRIPVSMTDRITVKDIVFSPEPARRNVDEKAGITQWDIKMAPEEVTDITISFTVSYPKDMPPPVF